MIKTAIFSDLIRLREADPTVFSELFYGRSNEIIEFSNAIKPIAKSGSNFIIVGDAGIGKSTFLYKIFLNEAHELDKFIYPIFIDFRQGAINLDAALINFIDKMDSYFSLIKRPINTLDKPKEKDTIPYNFLKISEHLAFIPVQEISKRLLLLVDDLDYADDFWLEFLLRVHNLVVSPKLSFVLSLRPLLEFKIRTSSDTLYRDLIRGSRRIELSKLSVEKVLQKRLAPIIMENDTNPFHLYIKRLFNRDSSLCRVLRKQYGVTNLEQLARFQFPFHSDLIDFMAQITNGNMREVFDIAEAVLRYIFKNAKKLESVVKDGEITYKLSQGALIDLFYKKRHEYESNYELFNINECYSKLANSLHFNVLEAVKYQGNIDERALHALTLLGHNRPEVSDSLDVLEDRIHRLIIPKRTNKSLKGNRKIIAVTEYEITKKGEKYLEMATQWQCYIDEFKEPGKSLLEVLK